jgi:hypothetical protein
LSALKLSNFLIVVGAEIRLGFFMVRAFPGNPRRIALEEAWQWRVNEARQAFEKQPTVVTREQLERALYILGDLILRGAARKRPAVTEHCLGSAGVVLAPTALGADLSPEQG